GAFLVLHLAMNARAIAGDAAFARAVDALHRTPALPVLEALLVFAPLLFHAGVGAWLVLTRRSFAEPSPYPGALRAAVRATGLVVLAFLAMHLPELRFRALAVSSASSSSAARLDGGELATALAADLSSVSYAVPWRGAAYLVGAGCVTFHFAA